MDKQIERVARQIATTQLSRQYVGKLQKAGAMIEIDKIWPEFVPEAQAAIEVMRGPTKAVIIDTVVAEIKQEVFDILKTSTRVWIVEERGAQYIVHSWSGAEWKNGEGVGPPSDYPTLRKAVARVLQLFGIGAVAPQTWPESVCLGSITMEPESSTL